MSSSAPTADQQLEAGLKPLLDILQRYLNPHRCLWLLALACFLPAWNRGQSLLYAPLMLILAVQVLSWWLPRSGLRGISVRRKVSAPTQAGGQVGVTYLFNCPGKRYQLTLHEHQALGEDDTPFSLFLPVIAPDQVFEVSMSCQRRGVFALEDLDISCGRPFGIMTFRKRVSSDPVNLIVYPKTFPIEAIPLSASDLLALEGQNLSTRSHMPDEFAGVREHRHGDSLKHVHWGASARQRSLVVREYESHDRPDFLVVLDAGAKADIGKAPHSTFEYSVMIAASMIQFAVSQGLGLHVYCSGSRPLALTVAPGARSHRDFLLQLAWVRADSDLSYSGSVRQAIEHFGQVNTLVTFRNYSRPAGLPDFTGGHLDIQFMDQSFTNPNHGTGGDGWTAVAGNHRRLLVNRHSDLAGFFKTS